MSLTSADLQAIAQERYGVSGTVWHVAQPTPPVYGNNTTYSIGRQVLSASYSGGGAHVYECVVGGTSRSSGNPTWPTDGSQVFDTGSSGLKWQDMGVCPVPGNDSSDGLSWGTAFATASHALSVVTAGDRVQLAAGDFNGVYGLTVPVGVTVAGAGMGKTRIRNVSYTVFTLRSNTTLEDLSILFEPISFAGVNPSSGVPIDISYAEGTIYVRRVFCGIAQDSIIVHKQLVPRTLRLVVEDCVLWSCFDNYNVCADPAVGDVLYIDSYRCTFYANGQNLSGVTPRNLAIGQSGGNVAARFFDCRVRSENGNVGGSFVTGMIVYSGAKVEVYGGEISVANAGTNQLSAIDNTGQGTTGGTVSVSGCVYDHTLVAGTVTNLDAPAVPLYGTSPVSPSNPLPVDVQAIAGDTSAPAALNTQVPTILTQTNLLVSLAAWGTLPQTIVISGLTADNARYNGAYPLCQAVNSVFGGLALELPTWGDADRGIVCDTGSGIWYIFDSAGGPSTTGPILDPSGFIMSPWDARLTWLRGEATLTPTFTFAGGSTINPQDVRDALKLAPSAGTPAEGSIDVLIANAGLTPQDVADALKLAPSEGTPAAGSLVETVGALRNPSGAGATPTVLTVKNRSGANLANCRVQLYLDQACTQPVPGTAAQFTDKFGKVAFNLGSGSYWVLKTFPGANFNQNPQQITVG